MAALRREPAAGATLPRTGAPAESGRLHPVVVDPEIHRVSFQNPFTNQNPPRPDLALGDRAAKRRRRCRPGSETRDPGPAFPDAPRQGRMISELPATDANLGKPGSTQRSGGCGGCGLDRVSFQNPCPASRPLVPMPHANPRAAFSPAPIRQTSLSARRHCAPRARPDRC